MPIGAAIAIGALIVSVLIGFDVYLALDGKAGNTWSEIVRDWSGETPIVPWICGVLTGHFFHPESIAQPLLGQPNSIALLIWLTVAVAIVGLVALRLGVYPEPWLPLLPAFIAGALLWPV